MYSRLTELHWNPGAFLSCQAKTKPTHSAGGPSVHARHVRDVRLGRGRLGRSRPRRHYAISSEPNLIDHSCIDAEGNVPFNARGRERDRADVGERAPSGVLVPLLPKADARERPRRRGIGELRPLPLPKLGLVAWNEREVADGP